MYSAGISTVTYKIIIFIFTLNRFQLISGGSALFAENKIRIDVKWPSVADQGAKEAYGEEMFITSSDKEKYKCVLPSSHSAEKMKSEPYMGPTPLRLLKPIFSQILCYYRIESYWTYELCHGYHFRQFHDESLIQRKNLQEFYLGKFDKANENDEKLFEEETAESLIGKLPTVRVDDAELPYYALNFTKGSFCALSGRDRFTRILYVCHPKGNNAIYSHKELSSCEYEVIVLTTLLCTHPAFRIDYFMESTISCYPLPNSPPQPNALTKLQKEVDEYWEDFKLKTFGASVGTAVPIEAHSKDEVVPDIPEYNKKLIEDILANSYCVEGGAGWWRHVFCYGKQIQQFHINPDGSRTIIMLGQWDLQKHLAWLETYPYKKPTRNEVPTQVSHLYSNGAFCEETQKPRQVEVRLKCKSVSDHPEYVSLSMSEHRTCEYILTIETSVFCTLLASVDENGLTRNLKL